MPIIKNRFTGKPIAEGDESVKKLAEENKADLWGAYLRGAYLREADLRRADLRRAHLERADLGEADLRGADLGEAYLRGAYLREADLKRADLRGADLGGAKIEFYQFPSVRLLSSIYLGILSDNLTLELMRRDAYGHPQPELFDRWASGGDCPYLNEERLWHFKEKKKLWKPGNPEMTDRDLVVVICKEKNWKIRRKRER